MQVLVLVPAFNAGRTLESTILEVPRAHLDEILLVNDGSTDDTAEIAGALGLEVISHASNRGYGATQKTGFREALRRGAGAVVLLHSDHQYDPADIPRVLAPIEADVADAVLGSRLLAGDPRELGMAHWRYLGNRLLTRCENRVLELAITDYHSGLRAYSSDLLRSVPFEDNSDGFLFDQEMLVQARAAGLRLAEVPARCRYFPGASSISFLRSVEYGLGTLAVLGHYRRHRSRSKNR